MREDGHMATGEDLEVFAARHRLATLDVSDVVDHGRAAAPAAADEVARTGRLMRDVMGHFATGVSVITARDAEGKPVGTTASAISSVSLDPPLLLACLARSSNTLAAIRETGRLAINILADEQRHHSDRFAKKGDAVRLHEVDFHDHDLGVPTIPGALATIACEVHSIYPAGDHEIVVGFAQDLQHREPGAKPLLFYRGSYSDIQIEEDELAA
jgi:flavin reductase (DIM6/NTAB) family NADH-FMN oxidoreductase RutF